MSTRDTMPFHGWRSAVLEEAGVSFDDHRPFREMVQRWYQAGEPVSMAAHSLRIAVRERARSVRIEAQAAKDMPGAALRRSFIRGAA